MANAIEQIYNQLVQVFGGSNPNQVFTMLMPGTTLNAKDYSYDTTQLKPASVQQAEAQLADQMFDIAKVSGSSNGQRVSSQYMQALSVLVPKFNPMMPVLKKTLRDFLNRPVPPNTMLDGNLFTGTMQQYYFKLYDNYIAVKLEWEQMIIAKKNELGRNPDTANELFLEWYEQIAEAELAKVDEALAKVLGVFAPSDMNAILGALASGPGGEVEEATNIAKDVELASPDGGYFYPVNLTPSDWFLDLASDINPVNLLKDPEFLAQAISAKRQALMASISQVQAMLNDMPTKGDIKKAADALQTVQQTYINAQNNLLNTYADNTATAVEMYLAKRGSGAGQGDSAAAKSELDNNAIQASKAKGENPPATGATKKDGSAITPEDVQKLVDGQKKLVEAQSALQTSSQALADAGMNLASDQASYFGDLPVILARLQSQVADITNSQSNLAQVSAANGANAIPPLAPVVSDDVARNVNDVLQKMQAAATATNPAPTAQSVTTAVTGAAGTDSHLASLSKAATDASHATTATVDDVVAAVTNAANKILRAPVVKKSDASDRFMELQLSFTSDDMSSSSSTDTSFSQTSWSVDLFFGSASGSSSSSSAVTSKNSLDQSTEIKVGLKAAKVDIGRGWFNPGIFKLSKNMNRIASNPVSAGGMPTKKDVSGAIIDWTQQTQIATMNQAILPSYPVAFVIVKDVNITFKATESALSALHTVLDSKSAAGGGFLCFSASSSSASHSDHSSMSTRSQGTVININMPGPQILGWFLEMTPADQSDELKTSSGGTSNDYLDIIEFINKLSALSAPLKLQGAEIGNGQKVHLVSN